MLLKRFEIWKIWELKPLEYGNDFQRFWENVFKGMKALNSFQSLENNFDDDRDIIGVHFRVFRRAIAAELF